MCGKIPSSTPIRNTTGKLEPLCRVQRHQDDLVFDVTVGKFVGVGDERHLFEELVHHRELVCRPDEFAEVLDTSVRLDRVLRASISAR